MSGFQNGQTAQDELLAISDPKLAHKEDCQDPFDGQDPYNEAIKLLAATSDGELECSDSMDVFKEDSDVISPSQSHAKDGSHSSYITPAPAATAPQVSVAATDG